MKSIDYLHLQMKLEGIDIGNGNRISRSVPNVADFPLVIHTCTSDKQNILYLDDSLPIGLHNQLANIDPPLFKVADVIEVFRVNGLATKPGYYRTYIFPDNFATIEVDQVKCLNQDDLKVISFGFNGFVDKIFAIEQDGVILSFCVSSRQNATSAEAWVLTHPDHRRKGLAQQVVTAWASSLLHEGLTPFYSHAIENTNSAKLANKLNLIHVFDEQS